MRKPRKNQLCRGLKAENQGICIEVNRSDIPRLTALLQELAASPCPTPEQLLSRQAIGNPEKWDWMLPDRLFYDSFASTRLYLAGSHAWCVEWVSRAMT